MKLRFSWYTRAIVYLFAFLLVVAAFTTLVYFYIAYCRFPLSMPASVDRSNLLVNEEKTISDGVITYTISKEKWDSLFAGLVKEQANMGQGNKADGVLYVVNPNGKDSLYINVWESMSGIVFSFVCDSTLKFDNNNATIDLSNIRLGTYEIPYISEYVWKLLDIPRTYSFRPNEDNSLFYLADVAADSSGNIQLIYKYNAEALAEAFSNILENSDKKKIELYKSNNDIDSEILQYMTEGKLTEDAIVSLLNKFEKSPESFVQMTLLLNDEGIRTLYDALGSSYYKYMDADKLVQISNNSIDSDLNAYHYAFSEAVLSCLYAYPSYIIENGEIKIDGETLTADKIYAEKPQLKNILDVEILADTNKIYAKYTLDDYTAERTILGGDGNEVQ